MNDFRLGWSDEPREVVQKNGETHSHYTVGPRDPATDFRPYSYEPKAPLECDDCTADAVVWRENLRLETIEKFPHLGKDWNW